MNALCVVSIHLTVRIGTRTISGRCDDVTRWWEIYPPTPLFGFTGTLRRDLKLTVAIRCIRRRDFPSFHPSILEGAPPSPSRPPCLLRSGHSLACPTSLCSVASFHLQPFKLWLSYGGKLKTTVSQFSFFPGGKPPRPPGSLRSDLRVRAFPWGNLQIPAINFISFLR
jgi:hypothetical protein